MNSLRALTAALLVVASAAACSGGDESAGTSEATPDAAVESTAPRTVTVTDFCEVDAQFDTVLGDMQPGEDFTAEQLRFFDQVKAVAPAEISAQVVQVVDELFLARRLFDPAALQDPGLQAANQAIEQYVVDNCGTGGGDPDGAP